MKQESTPGFISNSPLAGDLIRIGDEAIAREDDAKLGDCSRRITSSKDRAAI
jgi:hypothetical protein